MLIPSFANPFFMSKESDSCRFLLLHRLKICFLDGFDVFEMASVGLRIWLAVWPWRGVVDVFECSADEQAVT